MAAASTDGIEKCHTLELFRGKQAKRKGLWKRLEHGSKVLKNTMERPLLS